MVHAKTPPKKLLYKGSTYVRAKTEADRLWGKAAPLLKRLHESAIDDKLAAEEKKARAARDLQELREYLKLLGL